MVTPVIMPKQGNTVESVILIAWKKQIGDTVRAGEGIADAETDKAVIEIASPADGVILAHLFTIGAEVPVMTAIAMVGQVGEEIEKTEPLFDIAISPRARKLAAQQSLDVLGITGTGADGRIVERDIRAALAERPATTRAAREVMNGIIPSNGTGIGGRVTAADLRTQTDEARVAESSVQRPNREEAQVVSSDGGLIEEVVIKGVRKVIAERMRASLQNSAQVTLNTSADARALQAYRKRLKASPELLGVTMVSISDLILFATARTLMDFRDLNATLHDGVLRRYADVHLGFAVDVPRGLLVPVIRNANRLTLKALATEAKRLVDACLNGTITPDEMSGGTFTVSNLGSLGIESFTPVISPPQVAILGIGKIDLKAVMVDDEIQHLPHLHLSLTIDHQVIDGAPGARFLNALANALMHIDVMTAG